MRKFYLLAACASALALWACGGESAAGNGAWTGTFPENVDGGGGFEGVGFDVQLRVIRKDAQFMIVGSAARLVFPEVSVAHTADVSGSVNENILLLTCVFTDDARGRGGDQVVVSINGPMIGGTVIGTYSIALNSTVVSTGDITLNRFAIQAVNAAGGWSGTYTETLADGALTGTWQLSIAQTGSEISVIGSIDEHPIDGSGVVIGNTISMNTSNKQLVHWLAEVNGSEMSGEWWAEGWGSGTFSFTGTR